jgi:hypothetical protein
VPRRRFPLRPAVLKLLVLLAFSACLHCNLFAQTNFAVLTSDGAWTWYNDPRALYHNGILYFGYVRNADGRSVLSSFNTQTGAKNDLFTSTRTEKDDHNNPGLLVKNDGTMLAIYARHGTDQFFEYHLSNNTNPVTAADWGPELTIPATGGGLTYANPYQLSAETNLIYDFSRDLNFNPTVFTSANGGANWTAPQLFIKTGTGSIRPYVKYSSDYNSRIDFLYTDGHPRDITNSLYNMYYQGGGLYKTDGTFIKSFTNLPVMHDLGERGSVIYQYSDSDTNDPNDHIPTGRAWCWETTYQPNGAPVCVFTVQRDQVTGPNWYDDRIYYYYARWTGTNWQKRFIAQAGRALFNSEDDYAGGICVDPNNPNTIYISSNAQNPFNLTDTTNVTLRANERYEIWRGVTSDGGLTFNWTAITTNSAKDNLRPYIPRRQTNSAAEVIWFRGTYTTFNNYNCEVVGLFNNSIPSPPTVTITSPVANPVTFTNLSNKLRVVGTATDDGIPGPLTYVWGTVSGPTNATFESPMLPDTVAAFPLPGVYRISLSASDGASTSSAETLVNVGITNTDLTDATRVLWLKLDESSGTTASDSSGNGNNGTLAGGGTWQPTSGARAGALKFNGLSGQATIPDSPLLDNTSAFSISWWFRADAYPGDSGGLVSKRININTDNAYTTWLKTTDKRIYVDIDGSGNRFSSATLIQTGLWYHVALTFDGNQPAAQRVMLWINGSVDTVANESSAVIPNYASSLMLGNTHPGATNWFNGAIDDVRFYRRVLSTNEILSLAVTNFAPVVDAGPISPATNGYASSITGRALDDGKGGPLTVRWTKAAGPGKASFANSNLVATTVAFDHSGSYVLRLSASDTTAEIVGDLPISVAANTNIFEDWLALFYPGETNSLIVAPAADPEHDTIRNVVEFALGMNPAGSDAQPFALHQPGLPYGKIQAINGTNYFTLLVQRPIGRIGISYVAQVSADLLTWSNALQVGSPVPNGDGTETITFRDNLPSAQSGQRYMRLLITGP